MKPPPPGRDRLDREPSDPPRVVLLCGPAGSGKSTHARRLGALGYRVVSFDAIAWELGHRTYPLTAAATDAVVARMSAEVWAAASAGDRVAVDAAHWSRASRDAVRAWVAPLGIDPVVHRVRAPRALILERLAARTGADPDQIEISPAQVEKFLASFEEPDAEEGPVVAVDGF